MKAPLVTQNHYLKLDIEHATNSLVEVPYISYIQTNEPVSQIKCPNKTDFSDQKETKFSLWVNYNVPGRFHVETIKTLLDNGATTQYISKEVVD